MLSRFLASRKFFDHLAQRFDSNEKFGSLFGEWAKLVAAGPSNGAWGFSKICRINATDFGSQSSENSDKQCIDICVA